MTANSATGVAGGLRKTGWGQSGKLTTGNTQMEGGSRLVGMQCDFPGDSSWSYTVQFRTSAPAGVANPEALIIWSVEGQFVTRRVSVADGTSVTGVGQAVSVRIYDNTPTMFNSPQIDYNVSVQVAPGVRGSSEAPPTLSALNQTNGFQWIVNASNFVNVPIQRDAGVTQVFLTVLENSLTPNPIPEAKALAFLLNGAALQKVWDVRELQGWIPLNPGASILQLRNTTVAQNMVFTVDFGIDG